MRHTKVMNTDTSPFGGLDPIIGQKICGWVVDPVHLGERLRIVVLLDGDIAGFAHADHLRPELAASQIGDGAYGFWCELPVSKVQGAQLLTVLAETKAGLTVIAERSLRILKAAPDLGRSLAVHFDITDLLEYIDHHRTVSGIQRVQCGYLANALNTPDAVFTVRVCAQKLGLSRYIEISNDATRELLQAIETKCAMPDAAWKDYVDGISIGTGLAPDFQRGDILATIGATWVHDQYHTIVDITKRTHGIFYFQMLHDLIPTLSPEGQTLDLIARFNHSMAGMLATADHILTNSRHTEQNLLQVCGRLGVALPETSVVPLGATLDYNQQTCWPALSPEDEKGSPCEEFGDYVLCVGTIEPRKNHIYLYAIWKRMLEEQEGEVPKLVCVGRMGGHMEDFQRHLAVSANLGGHFIHLTDISDATLKRLYRDCLFTVFPSMFEGWGLPVAESLLFGKLCVSSNATSLPEVGGDWVAYIDPQNVNDGYQTIADLLDDRSQIAARENSIREGYHPLTWRAATDAMMDIMAAAHATLPDPLQQDDGSGAPDLPIIELGRLYVFSATRATGDPVRGLGMDIARRAAQRLLFGSDWRLFEDWGVWSCGPVARLGFSVIMPPPSGLICYLNFRLPHNAADIGCVVLLNGTSQGSLVLDGKKDHSLQIEIPAGQAAAIRLDFRTEHLLMPEVGAKDQRLLGIGIRRLHVCAADDLKARLAYFEERVVTPTQRSRRG